MLVLLSEGLALITNNNKLSPPLLIIEAFFMHSYTTTVLQLDKFLHIFSYKYILNYRNVYKYLQIIVRKKLNFVYK